MVHHQAGLVLSPVVSLLFASVNEGFLLFPQALSSNFCRRIDAFYQRTCFLPFFTFLGGSTHCYLCFLFVSWTVRRFLLPFPKGQTRSFGLVADDVGLFMIAQHHQWKLLLSKDTTVSFCFSLNGRLHLSLFFCFTVFFNLLGLPQPWFPLSPSIPVQIEVLLKVFMEHLSQILYQCLPRHPHACISLQVCRTGQYPTLPLYG